MVSTLTAIHLIVSVLLIIFVLLQFGKGAETGLLDAASQGTSFGPKGNLLSKTTTVLAILFLGLAVLLTKLRGERAQESRLSGDAPAQVRPLSQPVAPVNVTPGINPSVAPGTGSTEQNVAPTTAAPEATPEAATKK